MHPCVTRCTAYYAQCIDAPLLLINKLKINLIKFLKNLNNKQT